ncbi:MAG: hypothetical protein P4L53_21400 [Candidatus Obscuribacterales bacterium]|nr:hypothetical protein [Candidatus Obscuribacterales bacterium]
MSSMQLEKPVKSMQRRLRASLVLLSAVLTVLPWAAALPSFAQQYVPPSYGSPGDSEMSSDAGNTRLNRPSVDSGQSYAPSKKPLTGYATMTPELNGYAQSNPPLNAYASGGAPLGGNLNAMGATNAPLLPLRANLANQAPLTAGMSNANFNMTAAEQMRNHDVCILIDKSSSMLERDCPGDLSRWEWCQQQSRGLAQACAQAASNLTVALFSSDYTIYEHVQPGIIPAIFAANKPWNGTKLAPPLTAMLTGYFKERSINPHARPLIVAVITDGCPKDMNDVEHVIIDAANNTVKEGEISISFLVIGTQGADKMEYLDSGLVSRGAKRDIVNLIQFNNIKRLGTAQALAMALSGRTFRNAPHSNSPSNMFYSQNQNMVMPNTNNPGIGGLLRALTQ